MPTINATDCDTTNSALAFMHQRWMPAVLDAASRGARRAIEYRRMIDGISDRMLHVRLKELEAHKLIRREVVPSMPVQVFYDITDRGRSLVEAMRGVTRWAERADG
ncbi:transcriptional regulator, HxlR family [Lentzea fradiae]|uniref:Transcriptional regulator, HxlR family n=2 Tax=Lentzea fradiae TaxID=200378 RepID=A0A1G7KY31_9PSEU|nr:transcriptional regulator, HxlR family [Lentzea fradiae]